MLKPGQISPRDHILSWELYSEPLMPHCALRTLFVDTLAVLQADGDVGGCMKLQCLVHCAGQLEGLRAHRALDDCYALRGVIQHVAWRQGLSLWALLRNFSVELDLPASCAQVSVLAGD